MRCKIDCLRIKVDDEHKERFETVALGTDGQSRVELKDDYGFVVSCSHPETVFSVTNPEKKLRRFFGTSDCQYYESSSDVSDSKLEKLTDTDISKVLKAALDKVIFCHPTCKSYRYYKEPHDGFGTGSFCTKIGRQINVHDERRPARYTDSDEELAKSYLCDYLLTNSSSRIGDWFDLWKKNKVVSPYAQLRDLWAAIDFKEVNKDEESVLLMVEGFESKLLSIGELRYLDHSHGDFRRLTTCEEYVEATPQGVQEKETEVSICTVCVNRLGKECIVRAKYSETKKTCKSFKDNLEDYVAYEIGLLDRYSAGDYRAEPPGYFVRNMLNAEHSCRECVHLLNNSTWCHKNKGIRVSSDPDSRPANPCSFFETGHKASSFISRLSEVKERVEREGSHW